MSKGGIKGSDPMVNSITRTAYAASAYRSSSSFEAKILRLRMCLLRWCEAIKVHTYIALGGKSSKGRCAWSILVSVTPYSSLSAIIYNVANAFNICSTVKHRKLKHKEHEAFQAPNTCTGVGRVTEEDAGGAPVLTAKRKEELRCGRFRPARPGARRGLIIAMNNPCIGQLRLDAGAIVGRCIAVHLPQLLLYPLVGIRWQHSNTSTGSHIESKGRINKWTVNTTSHRQL